MNNFFTFTDDESNLIKDSITRKMSILSSYATPDSSAIRKYQSSQKRQMFRTEFGTDIDKILHNALYNRYTDKTQVFSFFRNDDITRRGLHVQLVSRIARIIGNALSLNLELIEAISLGHDIGHTPFGHKGEFFLDELYYKNTGYHFNHNVHSVRVFKSITRSNLTLQTLDGILCHCGEKAFDEYRPVKKYKNFKDFDDLFSECYISNDVIRKLRPSTLEGCVVRISDMIAYVGKDRQDAVKAGLKTKEYENNPLGKNNSEIISNLITNIIKNSIGRDYIKMDKEVFTELEKIKNENQKLIYDNPDINKPYYEIVKPMMENMYYQLLSDIINKNYNSPIFKHHLNHNILGNCYREERSRAITADANEIVVDYIASMTDDYFIDLYKYLFPDDDLYKKVHYISYFD